MNSYMRRLVLICIVLFITAAEAKADVNFTDPHRIFRFTVPAGWIYQAGESNDRLLVFYGPDTEQLLYIEYFTDLDVEDSYQFCNRVLRHFSADYGLPDFELLEEPVVWNFAGIEAAAVEYSFVGSKERIERRIFVAKGSAGLTITFSDGRPYFAESLDHFDFILNSWSWEVSQ